MDGWVNRTIHPSIHPSIHHIPPVGYSRVLSSLITSGSSRSMISTSFPLSNFMTSTFTYILPMHYLDNFIICHYVLENKVRTENVVRKFLLNLSIQEALNSNKLLLVTHERDSSMRFLNSVFVHEWIGLGVWIILQGLSIHEEKQSLKISCYCPFKQLKYVTCTYF